MKVLLCCGAGMSSGFLAQKARGAAKKDGVLDFTCEAHAESTIGPMIQNFDIVCLGPHMATEFDSVKEMCQPYNVACVMIPKEIYSMLDGEGLYRLCRKEISKQ
jgi:PTS system cellobiose-specific IIB component